MSGSLEDGELRLRRAPRHLGDPPCQAQSRLYAREGREMWERNAMKVRAHMAAWSKLKGMVTTSSGSEADAVLSQGQHTPAPSALHAQGTWSGKALCVVRARHLSRRVSVAVLPDNVQELDIVNAIVSLVTEVIPNMGLDASVLRRLLPTWSEYAMHPDRTRTWKA